MYDDYTLFVTINVSLRIPAVHCSLNVVFLPFTMDIEIRKEGVKGNKALSCEWKFPLSSVCYYEAL
jgi:hypothetical protein